jgi:hypothetical protein
MKINSTCLMEPATEAVSIAYVSGSFSGETMLTIETSGNPSGSSERNAPTVWLLSRWQLSESQTANGGEINATE